MGVNLDELVEFIIKARTRSKNAMKASETQRPGCGNFETKEGHFRYARICDGYLQGKENQVVFYKGSPCWSFHCFWSVNHDFIRDEKLYMKAFSLHTLSNRKHPGEIRGPLSFSHPKYPNWSYICDLHTTTVDSMMVKIHGVDYSSLMKFTGTVQIGFQDKGIRNVYTENFLGGLILVSS